MLWWKLIYYRRCTSTCGQYKLDIVGYQNLKDLKKRKERDIVTRGCKRDRLRNMPEKFKIPDHMSSYTGMDLARINSNFSYLFF